jgi:hypothetical protein
MSKAEAIFSATSKGGRLIFDNRVDLEMYCIENDGIDLVVEIYKEAKLSEKHKMYNYLFGPLMDCAVRGFTQLGYEGMDKVKARYKLEAEFLKEEMMGPQGHEIYTLDVSGIDKARLLKFIQDVIFFLETDLKQTVPDSSTYKMMKLTGRALKSVKYIAKVNPDQACESCGLVCNDLFPHYNPMLNHGQGGTEHLCSACTE